MNFPINYSFVTTKTLEICDDGNNNELTVLVLDTKANEAYWKKISSFKKTAEGIQSAPHHWKMNDKFIDMAVQDMVQEESNNEAATIFGLPVDIVSDSEHTEPFCVLALQNGTEVVNNFWK